MGDEGRAEKGRFNEKPADCGRRGPIASLPGEDSPEPPLPSVAPHASTGSAGAWGNATVSVGDTKAACTSVWMPIQGRGAGGS